MTFSQTGLCAFSLSLPIVIASFSLLERCQRISESMRHSFAVTGRACQTLSPHFRPHRSYYHINTAAHTITIIMPTPVWSTARKSYLAMVQRPKHVCAWAFCCIHFGICLGFRVITTKECRFLSSHTLSKLIFVLARTGTLAKYLSRIN